VTEICNFLPGFIEQKDSIDAVNKNQAADKPESKGEAYQKYKSGPYCWQKFHLVKASIFLS